MSCLKFRVISVSMYRGQGNGPPCTMTFQITTRGYFLGSIICINSATNTLLPKFEVVDGQQRLTTIGLLLAALYDVLNSHRDDLDEDQQSDVLQLRRKLVLKKTIQNMRVIPQVPKHCRAGSIQLRQKICKTEKALSQNG